MEWNGDVVLRRKGSVLALRRQTVMPQVLHANYYYCCYYCFYNDCYCNPSTTTTTTNKNLM
jgi:hypothetical protein